jgi:hypothetical protein
MAATPGGATANGDTITQTIQSLVGTWTCNTAATSRVAKTFSLASNGSIHLAEKWSQPNGSPPGDWSETYSPDPAGGWNAREVGNGWLFTGHSDAINNGFEFTGREVETTSSLPERERYVFQGPNEFDHAWVREKGVRWFATSIAHCTRSNENNT